MTTQPIDSETDAIRRDAQQRLAVLEATLQRLQADATEPELIAEVTWCKGELEKCKAVLR